MWADTDRHLRVVGVHASRLQAEQAATADLGTPLTWVDYANDTPPCWFANVQFRDLPGRAPEPGCYLIAERHFTE